ncbi:DNA-binding GntR family transcriptional regulator [Nocardioides sp. J9]|uniref:GntR family transcriptional regulator n=1 Tax=Nocardioides sp. J9 TaxID=935844 RepID=UPI0011ADD242|nr:GntR family transcriptional regulator [Nocardioides sp. J9]TWG98589.1 DNA-binding GntR family transcriptional regulator [Nocardioides sp. J9]
MTSIANADEQTDVGSGLVAEQIRALIARQELLPGQKIVQIDLANRLGVSRSPLREALRELESDGLVSYEANRGYAVARISAAELAQVYKLRAFLETEIFRSLPKPSKAQMAALVDINKRIEKASRDGDVGEMLGLIRDFHFAIFDLSDLTVFRRQVRRLWQLSEVYRAIYLRLPDSRENIIRDHERMLRALREYDLDNLVGISEEHRSGAAQVILGLVGG